MGEKTLQLFIRIFLFVSLVLFLARLFELQIIKGKYYKDLADGNRIRRVEITAPRGEIYARGGELLAKNIEKKNSIYFNSNSGYYISDNLPGDDKKVLDVKGWLRSYPLKDAAAHITGYLGLVNEDELETIDAQCPENGQRGGGDLVGRSGLELVYDCPVRGINGEKLLEVTAAGSFVRELGEKSPVKGGDIKTTIDYPLQEYVSTLFAGAKSAILVSDTGGEILAVFSSPSYDPNVFTNDPEKVSEIFENENLPLFNRVVSGKYSPGSVFKPVVAVSALASGAINKSYTYNDTGSIRFDTPYGHYSYSNWYYTQYGGVEGEIELTRALARSTDTFFYKIGELTGIDTIVDWSRKFGLSEKTNIDLPGEVSGLVPDPAWKEAVKGERWFLGNTYHFSIGQGDLGLTPIGIHSAISTIANGGIKCFPHITSRIGGDDVFRKNTGCQDLKIEKEHISLVKEGMRKACAVGGTGYTFFDFGQKYGVDVACKTGTAQVGMGDDTHAWFTAFAPVDNPEIVVTVLVEKGGEGSKVAGPIARQVFDFWFKDKIK